MKKYLLSIAAAASLLAGCGGSSLPYKTVAPPQQTKGTVIPASGCPLKSSEKTHQMGDCLPVPPTTGKLGGPGASLTPGQSTICVDLSNNDPIYGAAAWQAIARVASCVIFKVNESTGYIDPTAAPMARYARAVGLVVGGYDFQHICGGSASAEATVFANNLIADGLTGAGTLPGWADAEHASGSCNARAWESEWHATASRILHRETGTYTGAWFWNPTFGCGYWSGAYSWISGYGTSYPFMPCGHGELDLFQNTDRGYNGVSYADRSFWYAGLAKYKSAIQGAPVPPKPPRLKCFGPKGHPSNPKCKVIQKHITKWTGAREATLKAIFRDGCTGRVHIGKGHSYKDVKYYLRFVHHTKQCGVLKQRAFWFANQISLNLY